MAKEEPQTTAQISIDVRYSHQRVLAKDADVIVAAFQKFARACRVAGIRIEDKQLVVSDYRDDVDILEPSVAPAHAAPLSIDTK